MWSEQQYHVAMFGDDRPSTWEIMRQKRIKKEDLNYSGKTEWPAASIAGGGHNDRQYKNPDN